MGHHISRILASPAAPRGPDSAAGSEVVRRVELALPNPDIRKDEEWTVDTNGEGWGYLKGWIDQARLTNPKALDNLILRLLFIGNRSKNEKKILPYALEKKLEKVDRTDQEVVGQSGRYVTTAEAPDGEILIEGTVEIEEDEEDEEDADNSTVIAQFHAYKGNAVVGQLRVERMGGLFLLTDIRTDYGDDRPRVSGLGKILMMVAARMARALGQDVIRLAAHKDPDKAHPATYYEGFRFSPQGEVAEMMRGFDWSLTQYIGTFPEQDTIHMTGSTNQVLPTATEKATGAGWSIDPWRKAS